MGKNATMPNKCLKCGYERKSTDIAPDYECPKCGVIYSRFREKLNIKTGKQEKKEEQGNNNSYLEDRKETKDIIENNFPLINKGRKLFIICMVVVFLIIILASAIPTSNRIEFFTLYYFIRLSKSLILPIFFFFLMYNRANWSRICLFIFLLITGLSGLYGSSMLIFEYNHPIGILFLIMSLLNLFIGFVVLFNKSVKAFVNSRKP